jgi:hypothetical protein
MFFLRQGGLVEPMPLITKALDCFLVEIFWHGPSESYQLDVDWDMGDGIHGRFAKSLSQRGAWAGGSWCEALKDARPVGDWLLRGGA